MAESDRTETKSLRVLQGGPKSKGWETVARECVCFANGRGGTLVIGVEDGETGPPPGQVIDPALPEQVFKRVGQLTHNVVIALPAVERRPNGGEVLAVFVPPSAGVASTTDGRYYARVADDCKPVLPEGLARLVSEKGALAWELELSAVAASEADPDHVARLAAGLRASERVKRHVKAKSDGELLAHYDLVSDGVLTHLGVLWVGQRSHRARLRNAPVVRYLRYDGQEEKVDKESFGDDYAMTPRDQIEGVQALSVWNETVEVPQGAFRDHIPIYDREVVRELVANALVHRVYTTQGDIFVSLYADRLDVHSPGPLPPGVTPSNILHQRKRRNEALARLFHDLHLMEGEGTGYDRMYDVLLSSGRPAPEVREGPDRVEVTVRGLDLDRRALRVIAAASQRAPLRERERIVLGLLARGGPMTRAEIASALELPSASAVGPWEGTLIDRGLAVAVGRAAGQRLKVNPKLLRDAGAKATTTLVDIQNHRLRELVRADVETFPGSQIGEIIERVGPEIPRHRVQRQLAVLREQRTVRMEGDRSTARYYPGP